jgi:hypothetical protein
MKNIRTYTGIGSSLGTACLIALGACGGGGATNPAPPGAIGGTNSTTGSGGSVAAIGGSAPANTGGSTTASGGANGGSLGGSSAGGSSAGGATSSAGGSSTGGSPAGSGGAPPGGAGGSSSGSGGASPGACAGTFCDSFDRTTLGADWTATMSNGAVIELVTDKVHSGTGAVHMKFATAAGATFIGETKGFPAPGNNFWGRVWLYSSITGAGNGHNVYIDASTGVSETNQGMRALNTQGGNIATNLAPPDAGGTSKVPFPLNVWTCFEWHMVAATGAVNLYMGGTEIPGTAYTSTQAVADMMKLIKQKVGFEHYAAGAGGDMWIDDFAIGPTRINCN